MNNQNKIVLVDKPKTIIVKYATMNAVDVKLYQNATFFVTLYDSNHNIVDKQYVSLTNEEYEQWGINDDTVVSIVLERLGLQVQQPDPQSNE